MIFKKNKNTKKGFGAVEILVVIGILGILTTIIFNTFIDSRRSQAVDKNTETIVEILRDARSKTLSSKNDTHYGVHFATSQVTIFPGSTYSSSNPLNEVHDFNVSDTIITTTLTGGGSDVVFARLSGETSQNGTVVVSSPTASKTKTITIHKTGLVSGI